MKLINSPIKIFYNSRKHNYSSSKLKREIANAINNNSSL